MLCCRYIIISIPVIRIKNKINKVKIYIHLRIIPIKIKYNKIFTISP